jgi:hypothetical protein
MRHADVNQTNPLSLAHIAEMDGVWHEWTDNELDVMLLHQLGSEIQLDPKLLSGDVARKLMGLAAKGTPVPNRYCDLFRHPSPPIELLEYAKQVAKSARHHPDSPHQKISTVIYYSTIVVALMRCGRRITGLDDGALAFGVDWVLDQTWIDPSTRRLFEEARSYLQASGVGSNS